MYIYIREELGNLAAFLYITTKYVFKTILNDRSIIKHVTVATYNYKNRNRKFYRIYYLKNY